MFRKRHPKVGAIPGTLVIGQDAPDPKIRIVSYNEATVEDTEVSEGGAIRISMMTGRRAVKLTQSPIPQHNFVQAVIATAARYAICFVQEVASTSASLAGCQLALFPRFRTVSGEVCSKPLNLHDQSDGASRTHHVVRLRPHVNSDTAFGGVGPDAL